MPVWRDTEGNIYDSFDELGVEHLKNVVVLLTKRAEEARKAYKSDKNLRRDLEAIFTEARWRELLLLLEDASRALKKRLNSENEWTLDLAPKTPQQALANAEMILPKRRKGKGVAVETTGRIVERPRKLRIENPSSQ